MASKVKYWLVANVSFLIGTYAQYQMPIFEVAMEQLANAILTLGQMGTP